MNRKTRGSVAAAVVASAVIALTGCAGAGGSSNSSNTTLTLSRFAGPWSDASVTVIKEFTKETGINVRVDAIDYAQLQQKQTLNMKGKTGAYDVVYVPEEWYQQYINAGYLAPLSEDLKDEKIAGKDFSFDNYVKTAVDIASKDGTVYGVPDSTQTPLLCYDKDALEKANLQPPKTWDDLLTVAKYFKDQGTGIAMPARQGTAIFDLLIAMSKGNDSASIFTADGKLDLTNPKVVETADYLQELMKYSLSGSTGWHYDEATKALQFAQAPIGVCLSGLASITEDPAQSKVAGKLGYAPLPYKTAVSGYLLTWNYSVAADSKHKTDAEKLVAWLGSKDAQIAMEKAYPGPVSLRTDLFDDASLAKSSPWIPAFKETLENAATPPLQENASKLIDAMGAALNGNYVNNTDPKTTLEQVQQQFAGDF